jgi:hypothetical protein
MQSTFMQSTFMQFWRLRSFFAQRLSESAFSIQRFQVAETFFARRVDSARRALTRADIGPAKNYGGVASLRLHLRSQRLQLRFHLAQLPIGRPPCRAQRQLSSASPTPILASSRRPPLFAAAGAVGESSGERGYGSDLVARSTALPAPAGVGPARVSVGLAVLVGGVGGGGAVRDGAGRLIAMTTGA